MIWVTIALAMMVCVAAAYGIFCVLFYKWASVLTPEARERYARLVFGGGGK